MPRATFAGVPFDFLVQGLDDRHEGMTTVREIPGGPGNAYVDLGGPLLRRRSVTVKLDSEADYLTLAALPGTAGAAGVLTSAAEGPPQNVVLLSLSRTYRRGGPLPQLCRTEWLYTGAAPAATVEAHPAGALPAPAPQGAAR